MSLITLKGIKGGKDRTGLCSVTYSFLATNTDPVAALNVTLPISSQLPEVSRSIGEWDVDNFSFLINATVEGLVSDPVEDDTEYSLEGEFSEEPIETHPSLESLMKQYQGTRGDDGKVLFAERLESKSGSGTGLQRTATTTSLNPMFGVTSFPSMRLVASRTRVLKTLPSSVWKKPGSILTSLPSGFREPGGLKWITMPPLMSKRGNAHRLTERWKSLGTDRHSELLARLVTLA